MTAPADRTRQATHPIKPAFPAPSTEAVERPTLKSLAQWLVAMDEPESSQRRSVTLSQIIDVAREALAAASPEGEEGREAGWREVVAWLREEAKRGRAMAVDERTVPVISAVADSVEREFGVTPEGE